MNRIFIKLLHGLLGVPRVSGDEPKEQYAAHTDHGDQPKPEVLGHLFLPGALNFGVKPSRIQIPAVVLFQRDLEGARKFGGI